MWRQVLSSGCLEALCSSKQTADRAYGGGGEVTAAAPLLLSGLSLSCLSAPRQSPAAPLRDRTNGRAGLRTEGRTRRREGVQSNMRNLKLAGGVQKKKFLIAAE